MNGLSVEEKQDAYQYALNGADFMFISSPELCTMLINNSPQTQGINEVMTSVLLDRKPIRLDPAMIIKYCRGTLDKNNNWLFDNGNIKVVPCQYKAPVKLKTKEDNIKKEENSDDK